MCRTQQHGLSRGRSRVCSTLKMVARRRQMLKAAGLVDGWTQLGSTAVPWAARSRVVLIGSHRVVVVDDDAGPSVATCVDDATIVSAAAAGDLLVVATPVRLHFFDGNGRRLPLSYRVRFSAKHVDVVADDNQYLVAIGSASGALVLHVSIESKSVSQRGRPFLDRSPVCIVRFSNDARYLACICLDGRVALCEVTRDDVSLAWSAPIPKPLDRITSAAFSPALSQKRHHRLALASWNRSIALLSG
ncbi:unnamed protein product (mitochondrion) [Plasmodiophora brassicae]|uniref:Anaphase-promoting complex subunit 4 WD40 domain-containing protein n=2 Tax=Plasmodiophora brassicae TaxID=37360 RepID=A0A3P3YC86_PLABS|nr:unnamed protein product [Plasmodiophora brassicae]